MGPILRKFYASYCVTICGLYYKHITIVNDDSVSDTLSYSITYKYNDGKSAASFCRQVAARFPGMFCNFYLAKNHKIDRNSTTTIAREKNKRRYGIFKILEFFNVCLTKFKNNQILLNKISHRFLLTTKLFTG
jgi:hypothetical protein